MDNKTRLEIAHAMIIILSNALHGRKTDPDFSNEINIDSLFQLCQEHKVSALASISLHDPDERWRNARVDSIRRTILFDKEREQILKMFEKNQIWYCPLKGIILKDFYPEYGLREMADNDILFDEKKASQVKDIMTARGYKTNDYGKANHDAYRKKPIYNFEMHRSLFSESFSETLTDYYKNIKKKLKKDNDGEYAYRFSDEDFYIYLIAHMHKHISSAGSGLRSLIDIYLYTNQKKEMDRGYIESELRSVDLYEEERIFISLAKKLFSNNGIKEELNEKEKDLLEYFIDSGVYGRYDNFVAHDLERYKEKGKNYRLKYIFRRIYPDEQKLKEWYPFFYRHAWARPFLVPYRACKGLFTKRKKLMKEMEILIKDRNDDVSV